MAHNAEDCPEGLWAGRKNIRRKAPKNSGNRVSKMAKYFLLYILLICYIQYTIFEGLFWFCLNTLPDNPQPSCLVEAAAGRPQLKPTTFSLVAIWPARDPTTDVAFGFTECPVEANVMAMAPIAGESHPEPKSFK